LRSCAACGRLKGCVPLIFTSATDDDVKVWGFALGGDDFAIKPFGIGELVARVRAVLRRNQAGGP
jgi:DNA-binding response OmpR family regulator